MTIFLIALGLLLVGVALRDMFQTLFHPASHGTMSDWVSRAVWKVLRTLFKPRSSILTLAGPLAMFLIIASWTALIVFGCALVYYENIKLFARMPDVAFPTHRTFFDAWNISLGSLISLAGQTVAGNRWLTLLMSVEAMIGLGLVTASVSWLLSVYPILESRRTLARLANSIKAATDYLESRTSWLMDNNASEILMTLSRDLAAVRNETAQFPIAYYFTVRHPESELAVALPFIAELAAMGSDQVCPSTTRLAGRVLSIQVSSYLQLIAVNFLGLNPDSEPHVLLHAYILDHFQKDVPFAHSS